MSTSDNIYCCSSEADIACCSDPTKSVYQDQNQTPLTTQQKFRQIMFQIMIILYLCVVFGLIILDYFSHRKLDKNRDPEYMQRASRVSCLSKKLK